VDGTGIRQTLVLRLVNPCLRVLKILIRIPEILVWARSHHRAPSWKLIVKSGRQDVEGLGDLRTEYCDGQGGRCTSCSLLFSYM